MKKLMMVLMALTGMAVPTNAQQVDGAKINGYTLEKQGDNVVVDMVLDLSDLKVKSNQAVLFTPELSNGTQTAAIGGVGVYGRTRYLYYKRRENGYLTGEGGERIIRASNIPDTVRYSASIPFQNWMNGSTLLLNRSDYGCCGKNLSTDVCELGSLFDRASYLPTLLYVEPEAVASKQAELEGSANILFVVDKINIDPAYRDNTNELRKIYSVLDSIRGDADITVNKVWLKGHASPEGTYAHNTYLATNRTIAIRDYIAKLYNFDKKSIETASEPEDWDGVKTYLANSSLKEKNAILKIINTVSDPDARDNRIRTEYPQAYSTLLKECYPLLRHTDYKVKYTIRTYTDVEEMKRVFASNPSKLSLNELYLVAKSYGQGTDEYNKVMATAALLYPNDQTAALNAANVALTRGNLDEAAQYLAKSGDSGIANYTRGVCSVKQGDYSAARDYLTRAQSAGVQEAATVLEHIKNVR